MHIQKNILVCEDDRLTRTVISMVLKHAGYHVEVACDGQKALEKIRDGPISFEILITDNKMPRLSGIELVGKLRELNHPIRVIMITAGAVQIDAEMRARLRLDGFLTHFLF